MRVINNTKIILHATPKTRIVSIKLHKMDGIVGESANKNIWHFNSRRNATLLTIAASSMAFFASIVLCHPSIWNINIHLKGTIFVLLQNHCNHFKFQWPHIDSGKRSGRETVIARMNISIMKLSNKGFLIKYLLLLRVFFATLTLSFACINALKALITRESNQYHGRHQKQSQFNQLNNLQ